MTTVSMLAVQVHAPNKGESTALLLYEHGDKYDPACIRMAALEAFGTGVTVIVREEQQAQSNAPIEMVIGCEPLNGLYQSQWSDSKGNRVSIAWDNGQ